MVIKYHRFLWVAPTEALDLLKINGRPIQWSSMDPFPVFGFVFISGFFFRFRARWLGLLVVGLFRFTILVFFGLVLDFCLFHINFVYNIRFRCVVMWLRVRLFLLVAWNFNKCNGFNYFFRLWDSPSTLTRFFTSRSCNNFSKLTSGAKDICSRFGLGKSGGVSFLSLLLCFNMLLVLSGLLDVSSWQLFVGVFSLSDSFGTTRISNLPAT